MTARAAPDSPPRRGRWRPWASVLATVLILGLLMVPGPSVPDVGFDGIDFVAHVVLFGVWATAVQWEFDPPLGVLLGWAAVFALGTELLQTLAIERTFSVADIAADLTGVLLAAAGWRLLRRTSLQAGE